jgi:hypothetical protein
VKAIHSSILLVFSLAAPLAHGQKTTTKPQHGPVETTVCKIFDDPSAYNNKLVKLRGYVEASSEYSLLLDESCPGNQIWFAFADGSSPPQLEAYVKGNGSAGGRDSKGQPVPPMPLHLIRDANYSDLIHYLEISARGKACADGPPPALPPDCTSFRVTATFTGRVDSVSKRLHQDHLKRSSRDQIDGKGFGHMGMFDAQIVVQSVENVVAVDESDPNPERFHWDWKDSQELKADQCLRNAKLTEQSRNAIARAIADEIRPMMADLEIKSEAELEKKALDTRITLIDLNSDGTPEVVAQGMVGCGATGNCPFWVLRKSKPGYEVLLEGEAQTFTIQGSSTNGFRDIVLSTHGSYSSGGLTNYQHQEGAYKDVGCYYYDWTVLEGENVRELKEPRITPCR